MSTCPEHSGLVAKLSNLEGWQRTQNGSLSRLEAKIDSLHRWLIGLLGGMVVSLVLLIANLVTSRGF